MFLRRVHAAIHGRARNGPKAGVPLRPDPAEAAPAGGKQPDGRDRVLDQAEDLQPNLRVRAPAPSCLRMPSRVLAVDRG